MELLKRIKKYWHLLIGSLLFALVYVVLSLYVPKLIGLGTDKIVSKGNVDFQGLERIAVQIAVIAAIAGNCPVDYGTVKQQNHISRD